MPDLHDWSSRTCGISDSIKENVSVRRGKSAEEIHEKVKPRNTIDKLYTQLPYRTAETSKHGNRTEKIPSDWKWLVSLFGSRKSCKYLHI